MHLHDRAGTLASTIDMTKDFEPFLVILSFITQFKHLQILGHNMPYWCTKSERNQSIRRLTQSYCFK